MITPAYAHLMARYNTWQNASLYREATKLNDRERKVNCGAYFASIHGTLAHIIFGDMAWMFRFTGDERYRPNVTSIAASINQIPEWSDLCSRRVALDRSIEDWSLQLTPAFLASELTYHSMASGTTSTKPMGLLVAHLFNHQTHHRGQAHCMLTQAGLAPDDTDLPFLSPG